MRSQQNIRRIIREMAETMTAKEIRCLIEAVDDKVLQQIVKEIMECICGIKKN